MADAQVRTFQACSQGVLKNCASIRLTSQLGVGPSSTNLFEIAIGNLGSQTTPAVATSMYFATFLTGLSTAANAVNVDVAPKAVGGATLSDVSPWNVYESGDAIFLSAPASNGIGGCVGSAQVGGYGQIGQTCGAGQYEAFSFFTSRVIDVNSVTLADMEFVAIAPRNNADSCNSDTPCLITSGAGVTVTPEPASLALMLAGFVGIAGVVARRRVVSTRNSLATEA